MAFVAHRREKRQTLRPTSTARVLSKLAAAGADADAMLLRSVENGWTGIFDLPAAQRSPQPTPEPEPPAPPTRETEWATVLRLATPAGASSLPSSLTPAGLEALAAVGGWIQVASAVDEADAGDSAYLLSVALRFRAAYEAHASPQEVEAA